MKIGNKNNNKKVVNITCCLFLTIITFVFICCTSPAPSETSVPRKAKAEAKTEKEVNIKKEVVNEPETLPIESKPTIKETVTMDTISIKTHDTTSRYSQISNDTLLSEESNEESEFYIVDTLEESVSIEQLLNERMVKVEILYSNNPTREFDTIPSGAIEYFNIQQWSTPFSNQQTYQRNQNVLKVKGVDIDSVSIYYINNNYYLAYNQYLSIILNSSKFNNLEANIIEEILP